MKKIAADNNYKEVVEGDQVRSRSVWDDAYESRIREIAHDLKTLMEANQNQGFNEELKKSSSNFR